MRSDGLKKFHKHLRVQISRRKGGEGKSITLKIEYNYDLGV